MAKTVIKELIIILLIALAIILVLGVLLYEYVPTNKVIPEKVAYTTPTDVKEELSKGTNVDDSQVILTYEIDGTDLTNYKNVKQYVPGKPNPFSGIAAEEDTTTTSSSGTNTNTTSSSNVNMTNTNNNNNNNNDNTSTSTTTDSTSSTNSSSNTSQYFQDKGTK